MPTPDLDHVRSTLHRRDRDVRIYNALRQAWDEVTQTYPQRAMFRRASTSRALMWEHSVNSVVSALADDDGVHSFERHDTMNFVVEDSVFFRLKKADGGLISSNYPTQQARLFHDHDEPDLFGHTGYQRVEIVHTFNTLGTALAWTGVVARSDDRVIWSFSLRPNAGAEVIPFPTPNDRPAADSVLRTNLPSQDDADEVSE